VTDKSIPTNSVPLESDDPAGAALPDRDPASVFFAIDTANKLGLRSKLRDSSPADTGIINSLASTAAPAWASAHLSFQASRELDVSARLSAVQSLIRRRRNFGYLSNDYSDDVYLVPQVDEAIEKQLREIIQAGLDAEFEDGTLSLFDENLDHFLIDDTSKRILLAWSLLQGPRDHRYVFYRFLERLGYSPAVPGKAVPEGLLQSALQSSVPGVRAAAAHALGNLGDTTSVDLLRERSFVEKNPVVAEIINRHLRDHADSTHPQ